MERRLGRLGVAYLSAIYVFLFLPAVLVVVFSVNRSRFWAFPLKGFTLRWYQELLARPDALEAVRNSVTVAVPTMILAVLIGGGAAFALHRWKLRLKGAVEAVMLMPILVPSLIWGVGLLIFLNWAGAPMGAGTVIVGHVLFTAPYVVLLVNARLHTLDPRLEQAARSLGAGTAMTFRRVVLPHLAPAVISGALVAFAISFSDLVLTFFLAGGGFNTLPVYIYSLIQMEPSPVINAVASIVFATAVAAIALALVVSGRQAVLFAEAESRHDG